VPLAFGLSACKKSKPEEIVPPPPPAPIPSVVSVTVFPTVLDLQMNGQTSDTLAATVTVANGAEKTVAWTSSNKDVATVSSDGTVTALSEGTIVIWATSTVDNSKFGSCVVNVTVPTLMVGSNGENSDYVMQNLAVVPGNGQVTIMWDDPKSIPSGLQMGAVEYQFSHNGVDSKWTEIKENTATIKDLINEVYCSFAVRVEYYKVENGLRITQYYALVKTYSFKTSAQKLTVPTIALTNDGPYDIEVFCNKVISLNVYVDCVVTDKNKVPVYSGLGYEGSKFLKLSDLNLTPGAHKIYIENVGDYTDTKQGQSYTTSDLSAEFNIYVNDADIEELMEGKTWPFDVTICRDRRIGFVETNDGRFSVKFDNNTLVIFK
jgi:hypothetical protein